MQCDVPSPGRDQGAGVRDDEGETMSDLEWDGEHCPNCGSLKISKHGNSIGQDTGDEGIDLDYWECDECEEAWCSPMEEPK